MRAALPLLRTPHSALRTRSAFTLVELLIVIMIVGILTGLALSAIAGAAELAREQRTRAIIAKLDSLIMDRYESYRTRAVPIRIPAGINPRAAARTRLYALRYLMRRELPDRITDVERDVDITPPIPEPSLQRSYRRQAMRVYGTQGNNWQTLWSPAHQGSECLYLILTTMHDGDKQALDFFSPDEIGDTDDDKMKEILDGWGRPIEFLRWAPGYVANPWDPTRGAMLTTQVRPQLDGSGNLVLYTPDPFDPAKVDHRLAPPNADITDDTFELRPLLISGGRDKDYDIILEDYDPNDPGTLMPLAYRLTVPPYDPYVVLPFVSAAAGRPFRLGEPFGQSTAYTDNITNHFQETP